MLISISNDRTLHGVKIDGIKNSFTTIEIYFSLGFLAEFFENICFEASISLTIDEIIDDMCHDHHDKSTSSTCRLFLPLEMWILDDAIRCNLCLKE